MTPAQIYALFRSDVRDTVEPYLWSDTDVWAYINDAQEQFCRLTGGIADSSTAAICTVAVTAGDTSCTYDPRILRLRKVWRASDMRTVDVVSFNDLGYHDNSRDDYGFMYMHGNSGPMFSTVPGPINSIVTDMDAGKITLPCPAVADDTLHLITYRLPLTDITSASTAFEIDSQHHIHLLDWVKHLAHMKQDAETYDRGKATEFEASFRAYCEQARSERERRETKPRVVAYGGIV